MTKLFNLISIVRNLDEENALEFIDLFVTALKNAVKESGDHSVLLNELLLVRDIESRVKIQVYCQALMNRIESGDI